MDLMTTFGWVAAGTGFTFAMTALGAASVFFFRKKISENIHRMALGLAAGIMIAASVWSLLIPAMEAAQEAGGSGWLPAAGGFIMGVAFSALLIRTNWNLLWCGIIHSLYDIAAGFGDFAVLQTTNEVIANSNTPSAGVYLMNFCLFIPLLIYAIFLLRKDVSL